MILAVVLFAKQHNILFDCMRNDFLNIGIGWRCAVEHQPVATRFAIAGRWRRRGRFPVGQCGDGDAGADDEKADEEGLQTDFQHAMFS